MSLATVESLIPRISMDMYLGPHLSSLLQQIKRRCLCQYVKPYSSLTISAAAAVVGWKESEVLATLVTLISEGKIHGRINEREGLLELCSSKAKRNGRHQVTVACMAADAALLRMSLIENGVISSSAVKKFKRKRKGRGRGGRGRKGNRGDMVQLDDNDFPLLADEVMGDSEDGSDFDGYDDDDDDDDDNADDDDGDGEDEGGGGEEPMAVDLI